MKPIVHYLMNLDDGTETVHIEWWEGQRLHSKHIGLLYTCLPITGEISVRLVENGSICFATSYVNHYQEPEWKFLRKAVAEYLKLHPLTLDKG